MHDGTFKEPKIATSSQRLTAGVKNETAAKII
jgi:hypothetical protein